VRVASRLGGTEGPPKGETFGAGGNGAVAHETREVFWTYYIAYLFIVAVCYWSYGHTCSRVHMRKYLLVKILQHDT